MPEVRIEETRSLGEIAELLARVRPAADPVSPGVADAADSAASPGPREPSRGLAIRTRVSSDPATSPPPALLAGPPGPLAGLAWRYHDPGPSSSVCLLGMLDDQPAGFLGARRVRLIVAGREQACLLILETATAPGEAAAQVRSALTASLRARAASLGIPLIAGWRKAARFRRQAGIPAIRFAAWLDLPGNLGWADGLLPAPRSLYQRLWAREEQLQLRAVPEPPRYEITSLWERLRESGYEGIVRDHAWFEWRYLREPRAGYRFLVVERGPDTAGFAVVHKDDAGNRFELVDLLLARRESPRPVLASIAGKAARENWGRFELIAASHGTLAGAARRLGMIPRAQGRVLQLDADPALAPGFERPCRWWMTGGETIPA